MARKPGRSCSNNCFSSRHPRRSIFPPSTSLSFESMISSVRLWKETFSITLSSLPYNNIPFSLLQVISSNLIFLIFPSLTFSFPRTAEICIGSPLPHQSPVRSFVSIITFEMIISSRDPSSRRNIPIPLVELEILQLEILML